MGKMAAENKKAISHFRELVVYQRAFTVAMEIFKLTKNFPPTHLGNNRRVNLLHLKNVYPACGAVIHAGTQLRQSKYRW
jgi:hypothetical protein